MEEGRLARERGFAPANLLDSDVDPACAGHGGVKWKEGGARVGEGPPKRPTHNASWHLKKGGATHLVWPIALPAKGSTGELRKLLVSAIVSFILSTNFLKKVASEEKAFR